MSYPIAVEHLALDPDELEHRERRQVGRRERVGTASPLVELALTEARRMVLHPVFLVSVLLTAVAVGAGWRGDEAWGGARWWSVVVVPWVFLWVGTLVAAALVTGRQRWFGDPDLFPGVPLRPGDRAAACLLALAGPALVATVGVAATGGALAAGGGLPLGTAPRSEPVGFPIGQAVQIVLLVVLSGAVGAAAAQLPRLRLLAVMTLAPAVLLPSMVIWAFTAHPLRVLHPYMVPLYDQLLPAGYDGRGWTPAQAPVTAPGVGETAWRAVRFDHAALGWHLLALAGLVTVAGALAVALATRGAGDRPGRTVRVAFGIGLLAAGAGTALAVATAGHAAV